MLWRTYLWPLGRIYGSVIGFALYWLRTLCLHVMLASPPSCSVWSADQPTKRFEIVNFSCSVPQVLKGLLRARARFWARQEGSMCVCLVTRDQSIKCLTLAEGSVRGWCACGAVPVLPCLTKHTTKLFCLQSFWPRAVVFFVRDDQQHGHLLKVALCSRCATPHRTTCSTSLEAPLDYHPLNSWRLLQRSWSPLSGCPTFLPCPSLVSLV